MAAAVPSSPPEGGFSMRKVLIAVVAFAIPVSAASIGVVGIAGTAGASSPITCNKVTGSLTGTVHFKGCKTPWENGNAVGTDLANGGTLSWQGKHAGSISFSGSVTTAGQGACPAGSTEYVASDVVTAVTGGGNAVVKVGDSVKGEACLSRSGSLTLTSGSITS
jgi:hypothetical protein